MEHEGEGDTSCGWCSLDNPQMIDKRTGRIGNKKTSRDHPNHSVIKIGQNTEKSPVDLKRQTVTQTPMKNHPLSLVWKTQSRIIK